MAVIDFRAERNEIKTSLTKMGINNSDHYLILEKLYKDDAAYQRYLNNARKLNKQSSD